MMISPDSRMTICILGQYAINRLEELDSGQIVLDGQDIHAASIDLDALRMRVGFDFQQFNLFPHLSVLDNITLAPRRLKKMTKEEAEVLAFELLDRVGLRAKATSFPASLSGGQSQRVAIARSLAMSRIPSGSWKREHCSRACRPRSSSAGISTRAFARSLDIHSG
jgi:ABC-type histidine transport system ATPase subunit